VKQSYPVNEIFLTIQGEGRWTGRAAVFVRLQGCDVGCPWCDTKWTWSIDEENEVTRNVVLLKDEDPSDRFAKFDAAGIVDAILYVLNDSDTRHVVITGGEPGIYDLDPLLDELIRAGFYVQIESSGTYRLPMREGYWLTLSPKLNMPGGRSVLETNWIRADEIKLPVGKLADIEAFVDNRRRFKLKVPVYLQPLSQSNAATRLCVSAATRRGWGVSIQTHKYIGVR